MDPILNKELQKLKSENEELFDNGNYDDLLDIYNKKEGYTFAVQDPNQLKTFMDQIDYQTDLEKKNPNRTPYQQAKPGQEESPLDRLSSAYQSLSVDDESSLDSLLDKNKSMTKNILDYLKPIEGGPNGYNAYQGDYLDEKQSADFINMSVKGVLDWQRRNKNKAVGMFQFKPETLKETIEKLGIDESEKFTPELQDRITIELLNRAGYEDFLRDPKKNKDKFSNGLAKTWASVPLIKADGTKNAGESYYEGQGSNKAKGDGEKLNLMLDEFINRGSYKIMSDQTLDFFQKENQKKINDVFGVITPDYLRIEPGIFGTAILGGDESDLRIKLEKQFGYLGFNFKESDATRDNVEVSHPNIEGTFMIKNNSVWGKINDEQMVVQARGLRDFMQKIKGDITPEIVYGLDFQTNPAEAAQKMRSDMIMDQEVVQKAIAGKNALKKQLEGVEEYLQGTPGTQSYGQKNPAYIELKEKMRSYDGVIRQYQRSREVFSTTYSNLIDNTGGIEAFVKDNQLNASVVDQLMASGDLDPGDIKVPGIQIDGRPSSYNQLYDVLTDFDLRRSGEIDITINDESGLNNTGFKNMNSVLINQATKLLEDQTTNDYFVAYLFGSATNSILDIAANTAETIHHLAAIPETAIARAVVELGSDWTKDQVDDYFSNIYFKQKDRDIQKLKDQIRSRQVILPENQGDIVDSSGFVELSTRMGQAAGQSLPHTALFMTNPAAGLAMTTTSAFGESMEQARKMQSVARKDFADDGHIDESLAPHLERSRASMYGTAFAKAAQEALVTRAFTYKLFKDANKIIPGKASVSQMKDAVQAYRRGLVKEMTYKLGAGMGSEQLEENLISVHNMMIDEASGIAEYEFEDYARTVGNTSLSSIGSGFALSAGLGYSQTKASRKAVNEVLTNLYLEQNGDFNDLSNEIFEVQKIKDDLKKQGKSTNNLIEEQYNNLVDKQSKIVDDTKEFLKTADKESLYKIAETQVEIMELVDQAKQARLDLNVETIFAETDPQGIPKEGQEVDQNLKQRIEKKLKNLVKTQQKSFNKLTDDGNYKVSQEVGKNIESFVGLKGEQEREIVSHATRTKFDVLIDGTLRTRDELRDKEVMKKVRGKEMETDPTFEATEENAVYFSKDNQWDYDTVGAKFYFDRGKMSQEIQDTDQKVNKQKDENEVISKENVPVSRDNGLLAIEMRYGQSLVQEAFDNDNDLQDFYEGVQDPLVSKEALRKADQENYARYKTEEQSINKKAQDFANKYKVPVTLKQSPANIRFLEKFGIESKLRDKVVYPDNLTSQEMAEFDVVFRDQVRKATRPRDLAMRQTARNLRSFRTVANEGNLFDKPSNPITRNPKELQGVINFLDSHNYNDLTEVQKLMYGRLAKDLEEASKSGDVTKIPIRSYYTFLAKADQVMDEVLSNMPTETIGEKLKPQTFLESLFTGKTFGFADQRLILSMLFKNQKAKQPLLTLESNKDTAITVAEKEALDKKEEFESLSFLSREGIKVSIDEFKSSDNLIERGMLSYLGKYHDKGLDGQQKTDDINTQFKLKAEALRSYIENMLGDDNSNVAKQRQRDFMKVFNNVVAGSNSYAEVENKAKDYNVLGVKELRSIFKPLYDGVNQHMVDFLGREPMMFENYMPLVVSNLGKSSNLGGMASDMDVTTPIDPSQMVSGNLKESSDQTSIPDADMFFDNYEAIVFDLYKNTKAQLSAAEHISTLSGIYNSKKFSDIFDTESMSRAFAEPTITDFDYLKKVLNENLINAQREMVKTSRTEIIDSDEFTGVMARIGKSVKTIAQTKRLASIRMRAAQGISAMLAQTVNMGGAPRAYLSKEIARFMFGATGGKGLASSLEHKNKMTIISNSTTLGRTGKARYGTGYIDGLKFTEPTTYAGKTAKWVDDKFVKNVVEGMFLKPMVTHSDELAADATFLAFYMDYEMKNNPELRKMSDSEFFEYAANNFSEKARAYADDQVGRSQRQQDTWNQRGIFGGNHRVIADLFYMFGAFMYNRKAGMANDWSIINTKYVSRADKAMAARRLMSAAVEIGVFKIMSPIFNTVLLGSVTGLFASLLGFDDEIDKLIAMYQDRYGQDGVDIAKGKEFKLTNYERDLSKEFYTALADGMMPLPTPPIATEVGMMIVNETLKGAGLVNEDFFNSYNPAIRRLGSDIGPMNARDLSEVLLSSLGVYELVAEDYLDNVNSLVYLMQRMNTQEGQFPSYSIGKDRYVMDRAKDAADVLAIATLINSVFPSADLNTLTRALRGKINRDYLISRTPTSIKRIEMEEKEERLEEVKEKVRNPKYNQSEILRKQNLRRALMDASQ